MRMVVQWCPNGVPYRNVSLIDRNVSQCNTISEFQKAAVIDCWRAAMFPVSAKSAMWIALHRMLWIVAFKGRLTCTLLSR
jgi:hypothetical protein